jgi:hypothetical protein
LGQYFQNLQGLWAQLSRLSQWVQWDLLILSQQDLWAQLSRLYQLDQ